MARRQAKASSYSRRKAKDKEALDAKFLDATNEGGVGAGPELPSVEERQTFGHTLATWMVVEVAPDGLQATLKRITLGGDTTLTDKDLLKALREQYHITDGLDETLVQEVTAQALAKPDGVITGNHLIASGNPPVAGQDGRIEYAFQQRLEEGIRPAYGELKKAFEQGTIEEVLAADLLGLIVQPGEELARRIPATQGDPGRDIFGNTSLKPGQDPPLEVGTAVRESGNRYTAETYGYICLFDNQLSVQLPLWICTDQMAAHFVHFPQADESPKLREAWIMESLTALGVTHGIDAEAIAALCQNPPGPQEKKAIAVARGTLPVSGADTYVDYPFDAVKRAGKIMPDGSIDLRERNAVVGVEAGQSLGTVVDATAGIAGTNLRGEEIPTTDGREIVFKAGENVRADGDPPRTFFSEIIGNVHLAGDTIHVKEVFVVSGDIDYETGNIDTPKDVQVNGNIVGGFTVNAGGSITVGGLVEAGAVLTARGDITIAQGIVGEGTKVTAQGVISFGSVQTKFIQNATVMSKGNIGVGSYIFNSLVRSGGDITVAAEGGERGGSIVGGESYASKTIRCRIIGSPSTSGTIIGISPDPEKNAHIAKLNKAIGFCESNILRLLRTMGLQTVDAGRIKAILRQTPTARQQVMVEIVKKLYDLVETRDKSVAEREDLERQIDQALEKGEVFVEGTLHTGVEFIMGKNSFNTNEDIKGVTLFKTPNGIRTRPFSG